jgi:phosphate transport system protein
LFRRHGAWRGLIGYMIEDPRTLSGCLDMVLVAKALERIGVHAENIAGYVRCAVEGKAVRHTRSPKCSAVSARRHDVCDAPATALSCGPTWRATRPLPR